PLAGRAARQLQIDDVGAGKQQDEPDGYGQQARERGHGTAIGGPEPGLASRKQFHAPVPVRLRIVGLKLRGANPERTARSLERDLRLKPADDQSAARLAPHQGPPALKPRSEFVEPADRQPNLRRFSPVERHPAQSTGRDPHDDEAPTVDSNLTPYHRRIAAESALPQTMTDDSNRLGGSRPILFGLETAAGGHLKTERLEVVGSDVFAGQKLGSSGSIEADRNPD